MPVDMQTICCRCPDKHQERCHRWQHAHAQKQFSSPLGKHADSDSCCRRAASEANPEQGICRHMDSIEITQLTSLRSCTPDSAAVMVLLTNSPEACTHHQTSGVVHRGNLSNASSARPQGAFNWHACKMKLQAVTKSTHLHEVDDRVHGRVHGHVSGHRRSSLGSQGSHQSHLLHCRVAKQTRI